jgi:hypothetical protein
MGGSLNKGAKKEPYGNSGKNHTKHQSCDDNEKL